MVACQGGGEKDGHYEYRRKFVKEDGTVSEMVGVHVFDSEWDE